MRARFVRTAIEVETLQLAVERFGAAEFGALDAILAAQAQAVAADARERFHALDDAFHRRIGELAGVGYVWGLVRENKAHTDRVRLLSLTSGAELALADHRTILAALRAGDAAGAAEAMRVHLGRISDDPRRASARSMPTTSPARRRSVPTRRPGPAPSRRRRAGPGARADDLFAPGVRRAAAAFTSRIWGTQIRARLPAPGRRDRGPDRLHP